MCRRTLPLNALRALEVAGRHRSLTKASEELAVTPAAIRHQVKALEELLGVPLLTRAGNGVALTEAAASALPVLQSAFDLLSLGTEKMRQHAVGGTLAIACCPFLAQRWLLPRLPRFRAHFPGIRIGLTTRDPAPDLFTTETDIVISLGPAPARPEADQEVEPLMDDWVSPVCSRDYAARLRLDSARDLLRAVWLHDETAPARHGIDWTAWCEAAGLPAATTASDRIGRRGSRRPASGTLRFGSPVLAVSAAAEGHGVALAQASLVKDDLASGQLVQVPGTRVACNGYQLRSLASVANHPNVVSFREWVLSEASLDRAYPTHHPEIHLNQFESAFEAG